MNDLTDEQPFVCPASQEVCSPRCSTGMLDLCYTDAVAVGTVSVAQLVDEAVAEVTAQRDAALAAIERVRALWGGGEHPPVFLSDRPNHIVRGTIDRRGDLGASVIQSYLRLNDVTAALADPTTPDL